MALKYVKFIFLALGALGLLFAAYFKITHAVKDYNVPAKDIVLSAEGYYNFKVPEPLREGLLSDHNDAPQQSLTRIFQGKTELVKPHMVHAQIAENQGSFSHWLDWVLFSYLETGDKGVGDTISAKFHYDRPAHYFWLPLFFGVLSLIGAALIHSKASELADMASKRTKKRTPPFAKDQNGKDEKHDVTSDAPLKKANLSKTIMINLGVFVGLAFASWAAFEIYLRSNQKFDKTHWPSILSENVGFIFPPKVEVRHTDNFEYWTRTQTNELGFLDKSIERWNDNPGACRVLFLGDSFVEAAQVPISDKFHVKFEEIMNEDASKSVTSAAYGYSGTGQANVIAFLREYAAEFGPDVVIHVATSNDVHNNDPYIEAAHYGWSPIAMPREYFYDIDVENPPLSSIKMNYAEWTSPSLEDLKKQVQSGQVGGKALSNLLRIVDVKRGQRAYDEKLESMRRSFAIYSDEGWLPSSYDAVDFANMPDPLASTIYQPDLPYIKEAWKRTELSYEALRKMSNDAGADFYAFLEAGVKYPNVNSPDGSDPIMHEKYLALLGDQSILPIDMAAYMEKNNLEYQSMLLKRDGHWSADGHRVAAETLAEFFTTHNPCNR